MEIENDGKTMRFKFDMNDPSDLAQMLDLQKTFPMPEKILKETKTNFKGKFSEAHKSETGDKNE